MYNEIDLDKIDINSMPPTKEPARQYYYMAKCRDWVKNFERKNGRLPKSCVVNMGCQMNAHDSEKLTGILKSIGYEISDAEQEADFILFNTCTVRENANDRVYGRLGQLKRMKREKPELLIAVCGCMMQEEAVVEKIKKSYRNVDLIFGTHNLYKFAELLYNRMQSDRMIIDIWKDTDAVVEDLPSERKYSFKAGVNIMFGCNNFCSYCIVPYVRGRERSRNPEDIIREIRSLVASGVKEVMLLGQNVNSYGKNLEHKMSFAELLQEVEQVEGLERIRFMTSHPKDLSDELIETMRDSKKICRHLHLPVQSGSSRILEKMNRHYDKEKYLNLVHRLRREIPDLSLTTDIIVGFPGETEEDFQETLDVVQKSGFESAYTFIYSKRSGTPAAAMEGQVPEEIVNERFQRLLNVVQQVSSAETGKDTGKIMEVLVEEKNAQEDGYVTGRLSNNRLVHFPGEDSWIGSLVKVKLKECRGFYYMGTRI